MINIKQWTELKDLMSLLGYSDERSVIKWCKNKAIPIVKLGLKKYLSAQILTEVLDNQFLIFEKDKNKPKGSTTKYSTDNKIISKYLAKYESDIQNYPAKKRKT